jgi:dihydroorotate dehydrogenase (fumarate)
VIASLNGTTKGGWLRYAKQIQQAGADALELNIYYIPTAQCHRRTGGAAVHRPGEAVKAEVRIPWPSSWDRISARWRTWRQKLDAAGADGLVLFNRFYQPDYDLESLEVVPNLILSNSHELLLRLHWIAVLYGNVKADMALTGGVHSATDVVKAMMAGAKVAMMTSALLKRGISYLDTITTELLVWMGEHEYDSIRQMQGSMSRNAVPQPKAFERANYVKVLSSYAMLCQRATRAGAGIILPQKWGGPSCQPVWHTTCPPTLPFLACRPASLWARRSGRLAWPDFRDRCRRRCSPR